MYCKHIIDSLKRLSFLLCILLVSGISGQSQTNTMSKELPSSAVQVPQYFRAVKDIKAYFDQQGVPTELNELQNGAETYCFITAHPYSGVDTTDLYCFVKRGERWGLFLKAFLWKTPFKENVEFKTDGDFIDIICKGIVVLKINPPN